MKISFSRLLASFLLCLGCGSTESVHNSLPETGPPSMCGDGVVQPGEACEPGQNPYCSYDCKHLRGRCGDGIRQPDPEACDDGNMTSDDGCTACTVDPGFHCSSDAPAICSWGPAADPDVLLVNATTADVEAFCDWFTTLMGGSGQYRPCRANPSGLARIEPYDECVRLYYERLPQALCSSLTIGQVAECAKRFRDRNRDLCELIEEQTACISQVCTNALGTASDAGTDAATGMSTDAAIDTRPAMADAHDEEVCTGQACPAPVGSPCRQDRECADGMCKRDNRTVGFCSIPCRVDSDCGWNLATAIGAPNICRLEDAGGLAYCWPGCDAFTGCAPYGEPALVCQPVGEGLGGLCIPG